MNDNHRRNILRVCRYIDDLLAEIEAIMDRSGTQTNYYDYLDDVDESVKDALGNGLLHVRQTLTDFLRDRNIAVERQTLSAFRQIQTRIMFAEMGLHEFKPRTMSGYGPLTAEETSILEGIAARMVELLNGLHKVLMRDSNSRRLES